MKMYSARGTCATAMHIAFEWIGKPYEAEHLSLADRKSPEYLKTNASGVVPTLIDDTLTPPEGMAIQMHLFDPYSGANIGPTHCTTERSELIRWLVYLTGTLHPYFVPIRFDTDQATQYNEPNVALASARC